MITLRTLINPVIIAPTALKVVLMAVAVLSFPGDVLGKGQFDSVSVKMNAHTGAEWTGEMSNGGSSHMLYWFCRIVNKSTNDARISITVTLTDRHGDTLAWVLSRSLKISGRSSKHPNGVMYDFEGRDLVPADIRWKVVGIDFRVDGDILASFGKITKFDKVVINEE